MLSASIVVSALLLLLAAGTCLREVRRGRAGIERSALSLLVLRLFAVLLFFLILSGIAIRHQWERPGRTVAVLLDASTSMAAVGADSSARRGLEALVPTVSAQLEFFAFAETTVLVSREDAMSTDVRSSAGLVGDRTLTGAALSAVAPRQPGAILLLSDGRDNGPGDPVIVAAEAGIPVYTVGCGTDRLANLVLSDLRFAGEVHAGETSRVRVRAQWSGTEPAVAIVSVGPVEGTKWTSSEVRFDSAGVQELEYEVVLPTPGFQLVRAWADSIPGEVTAADNVADGATLVRPGRVRVRYLTDAAGPSSRFVTRALSRLPRVSLTSEIATGRDGVRLSEGVRPDLYVLDGVRAGSDWPGWDRVVEDVRAGAGALVLADSAFATEHPLSRLVPGGGEVRQGPVRVAAQPGSHIGGLDDVLHRLPPLGSPVVPTRSDRLEPWLIEADGEAVLAGSRMMGRGRVVFLAGSAWRWGFVPGDIAGAPTALERLLEQAVRFLTHGEEDPMRLIPTRGSFPKGDPVELELHTLAPDGHLIRGAAPVVTVHRDDDSLQTAIVGPLQMIEHPDGRYRTEISGLATGLYEAIASAADDTARTAFNVAERSREEMFLGLDDRLLREISRVSNGRYFHSDSLPGAGFELELVPSRHGFEFIARRSIPTYLFLVLLLCAEWIFRRRKGLR